MELERPGSTAALECFTCKPLTAHGEIRIFELLPREGKDTCRCQLIHVQLDDEDHQLSRRLGITPGAPQGSPRLIVAHPARASSGRRGSLTRTGQAMRIDVPQVLLPHPKIEKRSTYRPCDCIH